MRINLLFILLVGFCNNIPATWCSKEDGRNGSELIDFWTDSYNEILLQFRFKRNTQQLEIIGAGDPLNDGEHQKHAEEVKVKRGRRRSKKRPRLMPLNANLENMDSGKLQQPDTRGAITEDNLNSQNSGKNQTKETDEQNTTAINFGDACQRNCKKEPHIACGNNQTLSPQCKPGTKPLRFTTEQQQFLLDLHNDIRNRVAGNLTKCAAASRMATVQWHAELAEYALLNAMRCKMQHDHCHTTKEFRHPGQNLAWMKWPARWHSGKLEPIVRGLVNDWYDEVQHTQQEDLDTFAGNGEKVIGHFTAMVNECNSHMGCGAVLTEAGATKTLLLIFECRRGFLHLQWYGLGKWTLVDFTKLLQWCHTNC
uniref:Uncharacterized protein n=1 Tax=Musca domestica TaxID=7370 RepID=A0A1I8M2R6_MUSDO